MGYQIVFQIGEGGGGERGDKIGLLRFLFASVFARFGNFCHLIC